MSFNQRLERAPRKLRQAIVRRLRRHQGYYWLYPSYWRMKMARGGREGLSSESYFTATPNPDAGIGHQLANWIAGFWFAQRFGLRFAHTPFSSPRWERFFGFGEGEPSAESLKKDGVRTVDLPLFDEDNPREVEAIGRIIGSYAGQTVLFRAEQDQFYHDQYPVREALKRKFNSAPARQDDVLEDGGEALHVAVHVRRGDIAVDPATASENLLMRWQESDYFEKVLSTTLSALGERPVRISLFSQGDDEQFRSFRQFPNITFKLDTGPVESFLQMVRADILITSKSSFSYKPALLNEGVKIAPAQFWHGYPDAEDWVLTGNDGSLNEERLRVAISALDGRRQKTSV
jgi:hypothetical protein